MRIIELFDSKFEESLGRKAAALGLAAMVAHSNPSRADDVSVYRGGANSQSSAPKEVRPPTPFSAESPDHIDNPITAPLRQIQTIITKDGQVVGYTMLDANGRKVIANGNHQPLAIYRDDLGATYGYNGKIIGKGFLLDRFFRSN